MSQSGTWYLIHPILFRHRTTYQIPFLNNSIMTSIDFCAAMGVGSCNMVYMKFCNVRFTLSSRFFSLIFVISFTMCLYNMSRNFLSGIRNILKNRDSKLVQGGRQKRGAVSTKKLFSRP